MSNELFPQVSSSPITLKLNFAKLYFWTLSFLWPYNGIVFLIMLSDVLLSFMQLAVPKLIGYFIDTVITQQDYMALRLVIWTMVAIVIGTVAINAVRNILNRIMSEKPGKDVQFQIFNKLRDLGFSYYEKNPIGSTLSLINSDVSAMQGFFRDLPKLIQDILFVLVMLFIMFHTHWKLTLLVIPCFGIFYIAEPYLSKKTEVWGKKRADQLRQKNQQLYDCIVSITEVKAYGAEDWNTSNLMEKVDQYNASELKSRLFSFIRAAVRNISITIGAAVMFIYGAQLILVGTLQAGEFIAFSMIYFMAIGRFTFIFFRISQLKVLAYQVEKLYHFMNSEPDVRESVSPKTLPEVKGEIIFQNVSFDYPSKPNVVYNMNLHIRAGERVAFVGASGSGKTTLIKLISRFYETTSGQILVDGIPIQELKLSQLRDSIGHVFQETFLFGTSIKENIRFAKPDATDEEIIEAAKAAYAHEFIQQCPKGYETNVGERGVKLSGGQRQRIAIARMFLKKPPIIVLDEATSALDNNSEVEVKKSLGELLKGKTTIAIAHRLSTIQDFDRIIVVENGQIAETGTFHELLEQRGKFYVISKNMSNENRGE
jgi:ATP-binding cassette subfamily B protein